MMKHRWVVIPFLLLSGCTGDERGGVGPCVHTYKEPVLNILTVADAASGASIPAFRVAGVSVDNRKEDLVFLKSMSYGVVVYDSALYCNTPCGFGTEAGVYRISVEATGFRDTVIQVSAGYSIFEGGCPSSSSGGTRISFTLQPIQPLLRVR